MIIEHSTTKSRSGAIPVKATLAAPGFFARLSAFDGGDLSLLILRLGLAVVMFPHGAQKVLGWFGGWGFSATFGAFTTQMQIPALLALAAIAAEFLGPIGLVTGLFTRLSAFGIGVTMAVAALVAHAQNGFFMNWMGNQKGEGIEYFVLMIAMSLALLVKGGGRWSLDSVLSRFLRDRADRSSGEG